MSEREQQQQQQQQNSADDQRVEELILESLRRIERKVDDGLGELGRRITALEITSGQHALQLQRIGGTSERLVPWLMLAWNVFVTVIGVAVWLSHIPH